jgi:2-polyprenyl-6-methoxyphenol hydroxylase-like FAD-dependent oxidoreductase
MQSRAAIIGGSIGGLATGVKLARHRWSVTVVERDPRPDTEDGDAAFVDWQRPHVPQWRQPHGFSSRSRNLLLANVPEVVDRLRADGVDEINLFTMLAPPELHRPEDDRYGALWTRRPGFELALRREAEDQVGLELRSPAVVAGLLIDNAGDAPVVHGVRLDDGTSIEADVVIDAGGRRSPVCAWLESAGVSIPTQLQDCAGLYYSRYYRLRPESDLHPLMLIGQVTALDRANVVGFTGDHGTVGLLVAPHAEADEFKVLRHDWAWDAFLGAMPRWAPWVDPANVEPLTGVSFMGRHQNVLHQFVVDGRPLVHGLLPVGDSLCTTNPQYGWGASMTLTYAFAAADAMIAHPGDPVAMALAYHTQVHDEAAAVFSESAAIDRMQLRTWRNEPTPPEDRDVVERQMLLRGVAAGATHHPALGRAQLRRSGLLDGWNEILDDPEVLEQARHSAAILERKKRDDLSTADLLATVEAARPASAPVGASAGR